MTDSRSDLVADKLFTPLTVSMRWFLCFHIGDKHSTRLSDVQQDKHDKILVDLGFRITEYKRVFPDVRR